MADEPRVATGRSECTVQVFLDKQYCGTYFNLDPLCPPTVNIVFFYFQKAIGNACLGVGIFARAVNYPVLFILLKVDKYWLLEFLPPPRYNSFSI